MTKFRILLVEDKSSWKHILYGKLSEALRYHQRDGYIHAVTTFDEAWNALASDTEWGLLVTDIALLENNHEHTTEKLGIQLAERARDDRVPCLVVSGTVKVTKQDVRDLLLRCKVLDYFSKESFVGDRFLEVVTKILQESSVDAQLGKISNPVPLSRLRHLIDSHFTMSEFKSLCFDLGMDIDNLEGATKQNKIESLLQYVVNRGQLDRLVSRLQHLRPHTTWLED